MRFRAWLYAGMVLSMLTACAVGWLGPLTAGAWWAWGVFVAASVVAVYLGAWASVHRDLERERARREAENE